MSGTLEVPKTDSVQCDPEIGEESSLSVKKSQIDADLLLLRLAGKKKSTQDLKTVNSSNKKTSKTKSQNVKAPRGSIPKEVKPGKDKVKDSDNNKSDQKDNISDVCDELDDEELASFRELFTMLDQSNTGVITAENLFEEMRRVDSEITFEEVEDVLKKVDSDGSGTIDFDEFLYYITQMGDLTGEFFTKRKRLFYSAITQFSLKQTLADLEKTFKKVEAPHVISHYTAGARLIGLTTRQLTREMEKMQKTAEKNDSPYAKPLMFVHLGTRKIVKRIKSPVKSGRKSTSRSRAGTASIQGSELEGDKERAKSPADSQALGISKEIQNQIKLLAQRGSIAAQLPDAHKLVEWRRNISAQLRRGSEMMPTICTTDTPILGPLPDATKSKSKTKKLPSTFTHSFVTVKSPTNYKKPGAVNLRRSHKGWVTPRIIYLEVPLPRIKMKCKAHRPTFNDLPSIRAKAKDATDGYYRQLRQTEIKNAWEHWDRLYGDVIRPKKLLDNFRKVYSAYSPHREEESFVVCPWGPGPFRFLRHTKTNLIQSLPNSPVFTHGRHSPHPHSPKPFKDRNDIIVRSLTPLV